MKKFVKTILFELLTLSLTACNNSGTQPSSTDDEINLSDNIECMTVFGIPSSNGIEHSWNMVKLDGEWYCVDCAWDDPIGGSPCHTYFNVTSDYLRSGSIHRWNESSVPEATGTAYAYGNH